MHKAGRRWSPDAVPSNPDWFQRESSSLHSSMEKKRSFLRARTLQRQRDDEPSDGSRSCSQKPQVHQPVVPIIMHSGRPSFSPMRRLLNSTCSDSVSSHALLSFCLIFAFQHDSTSASKRTVAPNNRVGKRDGAEPLQS